MLYFNMLKLLILIVALVQQSAESKAIPVTACDLVSQGAVFDGKTVTLRAAVTKGPHDAYIVVGQCSAKEGPIGYMVVTYDPKTAGLSKFAKAMARRGKDAGVVTATLVAKVRYWKDSTYGFTSAKTALAVVEASNVTLSDYSRKGAPH